MKSIFWNTLRERCYVPYSNAVDICFVKGKSDKLYPGVRIENISFPLTIEPVQTAIFSCLSEGDKPDTLYSPKITNTENKLLKPDNSLEQWANRFHLSVTYLEEGEPIPDNALFYTSEKPIIHDPKRLLELTDRCFITYSRFPVTALLKTEKGVYSGVNIEISDWQKGLCAERVAIGKARSCGAQEFLEMAIYAPQGDYISPCGACRQVLAEHMPKGRITMFHNDSETTSLQIEDLLPYQFKASRLNPS